MAFNFLFGKQNEALQNYVDIVMGDVAKLNLSKLAIEKCVLMIAKAIAKSDFVFHLSSGKDPGEYAYRLNVQPNDNETGTEFWTAVVKQLLLRQEVLIVRFNEKYYRASSWNNTDTVLSPRIYSNITLESAGYSYSIYKTFTSDDVIHLRYQNAKIKQHLESVLRQYDKTVDAACNMIRLLNTPKFKLKLDAQVSFREKASKPGEPDTILTKDQYIQKLKTILESDELAIFTNSIGAELEHFKIDSQVKTEELAKLSKEVNSEAAMAFDIPEAVYFGNITEKSDATNEFITYAVGPVAEVLNDSFNAKLVGMKDYCKGERIFVWLARFKHVDVIDSASNLDKLRGIGFSLDEIREMVGFTALETKFSQARALTKNYSADEEEGEKSEKNNS